MEKLLNDSKHHLGSDYDWKHTGGIGIGFPGLVGGHDCRRTQS